VIGYGSLMRSASKERTWPGTGTNIPVKVDGFERGWNARGSEIGFSTTYLGVTAKAGAKMVAALYRVFDHAAFSAGDTREYVYCRAAVKPEQITMLDGSTPPANGEIWVYVLMPDQNRPANAQFPIIQSYVDIFLSGCLELQGLVVDPQYDLLAECITTTQGWPRHWVNDRIFPRRPFHQPNAVQIDTKLHQMLPEQFEAIRLE